MYKVSVYSIWKKRMFLVSKYFSELSWIYDVDIEILESGIKVGGLEKNVDDCLCMIESLLLGWKGGGYE